MRNSILLFVAALLAACSGGGSTASDAGSGSDGGACTMTLSGAATGSSACSAMGTDSPIADGGLEVMISGSLGTAALHTADLPSSNASYAMGQLVPGSTITVSPDGTYWYQATRGNQGQAGVDGGLPDIGTMQMTISSRGAKTLGEYEVHGSMTADCPPEADAGASVHVQVNF